LNPVGSDQAAVALGSRVRSMRREQGLTLKELGRRAALSHPFLSQLERGLARPSISSMERIARGLGVSVGVLWTGAARRSQATLVRRDAGDRVSHPDAAAPGHLRTLAGHGEPLAVCEWTGGSRRWPEEPQVMPGEVLLYVARGSVEIDIGGDVHALEEGDALIFDGGVPHRLRRTGGVATRALRVATPLPPA
jgi:transcriptional regulator with XRE-family HTH domain